MMHGPAGNAEAFLRGYGFEVIADTDAEDFDVEGWAVTEHELRKFATLLASLIHRTDVGHAP